MISYQRICEAINNRQIVSFMYHNHKRIVEPHLVGEKTNGIVELSAWQIGGYSESGSKPPWRNYILSDIINFYITDNNFTGTRPGYNRNDSTMQKIICRL